jgi:hypothetical protein
MEVPHYSLNDTKEGGLIKAGDHNSSKHTSHKRLGQLFWLRMYLLVAE